MTEQIVYKGENGRALTNSLLVARKFGKGHKHVLEVIRKLISTAENQAVANMFLKSTYLNEQNRPQPMYVMSRDGFTLLAMSFTGKKALEFKLEYMYEFNKMEAIIKEANEQLKNNNQTLQPKTPAEMLLMQAQLMVDQERRIAAIESKIEKIEQEREENGRLLLAAKLSEETVIPKITPRDQIRQLVNRYAAAANIAQQDVWHKIYDQLYYLYHISIRQYKKDKRETYLDVAERNNFLDKIYNIISNLIRERGVANNNVA